MLNVINREWFLDTTPLSCVCYVFFELDLRIVRNMYLLKHELYTEHDENSVVSVGNHVIDYRGISALLRCRKF